MISVLRRSSISVSATHNFLGHVTLNDNLVESLRVPGHTCTRGELLGKEFGGLLQVDSEGIEPVDRGDMFALVS